MAFDIHRPLSFSFFYSHSTRSLFVFDIATIVDVSWAIRMRFKLDEDDDEMGKCHRHIAFIARWLYAAAV